MYAVSLCVDVDTLFVDVDTLGSPCEVQYRFSRYRRYDASTVLLSAAQRVVVDGSRGLWCPHLEDIPLLLSS